MKQRYELRWEQWLRVHRDQLAPDPQLAEQPVDILVAELVARRDYMRAERDAKDSAGS